ncbi:maltose alpha-D-glucosyltransferase [Roseivirga sp. BDSF3-8]|uniref:maltose alpha-D-glucosyltransferase n=1 Tax=Roseivirga sp. BDSF3-8 TaxID=3241598 RepID=UPI003531EFD3
MANKEINDQLLWYKDAIIYELHIKAFFDSNNDGIGDFKGLLNKLDYLEDLGVTAIWLLPFYPSPLRDDGYDIADYYSINPNYGKLQHLKKFLKEARKRNIRVITELVINHTSDQHPWFQRARKAPKGSVERDFYVWSDNPKQYKDVRIIFQDFEGSNWTWDSVAQQYYWHRFFHHQPDLNYDNPAVQEEVFKILDFWLDMGVDGFRLDAVPYLFEREGTNCENLPETHEFLKKLRKHVDSKHEGAMLLAEANMWPEESAKYFGDGDECHMNYHFPIMPRMFMALKMEDRYPIIDIIEQTPEIPDNCQWAIFLRNHDELTLEMVTDEERDYMYKMYTKDPKARINLGIRQRLAPLLDNNRRKIELMNYLLFSLPGTPVIYYGDEIGMGDNFYLGDRDGVRTPMQWSPDRNAGFSATNPQQLYLPVISDPEYSYEAINVETQLQNTSSILWWMKRVIAMRKRYKAFSRGSINFLPSENSKILAFTREYEDEIILVVANLSRYSQAAEIDLHPYSDSVPVELFSQNKFPVIRERPYLFTLGPHDHYWFHLKPRKAGSEVDAKEQEFAFKSWDFIGTEKGVQQIEQEVLPYYLPRTRWYGGKARVIQSINVLETIPMPFDGDKAWLYIFEVNYTEGLSEIYQLSLAFIGGHIEKELRDTFGRGVIGQAKVGDREGVIYDAAYSDAFRKSLFSLFAKKKKVKAKGGELSFQSEKGVTALDKEKKDDLFSRVLKVDQSNTSIIYEGDFFLKLYRKLDRTMNPDLEITRFLTNKGMKHVPHYAGAITHDKEGDKPMVLAMMLELVPNEGDAWRVFTDSVNSYFEKILSTDPDATPPSLKGTLIKPASFSATPDKLKDAFSSFTVERAALLGERTAEMHLALASEQNDPDFKPEDFSLHYQRSLFSSLQTLTRETYDTLKKQMSRLDDTTKAEAENIMGMKKDILNTFKMIYRDKFESLKIRTHGDYHLGQVLHTGKDFIIIDFEGEPARSYSERRIKRSPLRDVAGMIRSFHYAAYNGLRDRYREEDNESMDIWAENWYHYMSGYFMEAYLKKTKGSEFIPENEEHLDILLQTFLLEKAIYELKYELNNRPEWAITPIRGIKYIMRRYLHDS